MPRHLLSGVLLCGLVAGCGQGTGPTQPPLLSVNTHPAAKPTTDSAESQAVSELIAAGKLALALETADAGIAANPKSATAYEARASVLHKLGRLDGALADLSKAVELDPTNSRLRNNRGFLRLSLGQADQALADFDEIIKTDPNYANAYNNRALLMIAQGRFRQAVLDLNQAIRLKPDYVDAYNNRGFAMMQLSRLDRALADFQQALQLDPKYVNAIGNRGLVKQQLGDLDGAVLDFTDAMMYDPENPKFYAHRREVYLLQGASERAAQDEAKIRFLLQLNMLTAKVGQRPSDPQVYLARARHYLGQGDETRALADLDRAVELDEHNVEPRVARATTLRDLKRYDAAIADCEAILAVGGHQQAYSVRGDCRLAQKNLDGALADFEEAKRLDPSVADALFLKGNELSGKGDAEAAKEYHARAEAIDPDVASRLR